jgi:hypothetical protein
MFISCYNLLDSHLCLSCYIIYYLVIYLTLIYGKTANTQNIAKAIEPKTTFTAEAKAIFAVQQAKILIFTQFQGLYIY